MGRKAREGLYVLLFYNNKSKIILIVVTIYCLVLFILLLAPSDLIFFNFFWTDHSLLCVKWFQQKYLSARNYTFSVDTLFLHFLLLLLWYFLFVFITIVFVPSNCEWRLTYCHSFLAQLKWICWWVWKEIYVYSDVCVTSLVLRSIATIVLIGLAVDQMMMSDV